MNKNTDPDIVTISDDSDVEIIQKVDNTPENDMQLWPVAETHHRNPKRKKPKANKSEKLPDLDNLSQEELDEYLSQVKGEIEEYNKECKATGQIGLQLQAIVNDTGSPFEDISSEKYGDYEASKIKNETPEEDDIELLEVKARSKDVKGVELKRKSVSDLAKRKARKKSDSKLALAKPRLVPRITSKTPISPMGGEKSIPSSFQRVKKVKPKVDDSYIEEELALMSHSGVDDYLQKPKSRSTVDKPVVKKKPKPPVEKQSSEEKMETKLTEIENIPPSLTGSLRKIMQMTAHTPEEKFKVLDARDKLYKIMRDKDPSLKRGALAGTCPDMCPEKERLMREFQYQVSIFEMVNYPKNTALDHKLAVKQYSRSSADQEEPLPHELRPINVLTMTMNYLLYNIVDHCELSDENLEDWYMFMWDRTRALRKELTQQGIHNVETVTLVEQCARFHIHCAERLVDQDSAVYDDKINTENLTKCLQTLKYMYKDLANLDIYCQNEPEFVCYSLLLNLNNTSVFTELSDMSERVMMSSPVRFALDIMAAWETRNYIRFFNLVKRTTYLNGCLLRRYFNEMRLYATKTMIRSYCTKNYSPQMAISRFVENLNFEGEEECQKFLEHCNFTVYKSEDGVVTVNFDRLSFQNPENPFPASRAYIFIEDKKQAPLSVIMAGGFLPPKSYENHVPQSSFTASGELKLDSLLCMDIMEFANMPPPPPPPPVIRDMSKPPPLITKPTTSSLAMFSAMLAKAQNTSSRDPRLREPETAPTFPITDEKPTAHVFTTNIFSQKPETEPQKSIFGQKPDSTSHSIFSKPETTTNSLFAKPEASTNSLFAKPEASTNLLFTTPENSSNLLFSKPETSTNSIFGQKSQSNYLFGQKTETTTPSIFGQKPATVTNNIFAPKQETNPALAQNSNTSIFGQNTSASIFSQKPSVTSTSANIFGNVSKNIFSGGDNHVTSTSASLFPKTDKGIFSSASDKVSIFNTEPKNIFARLGPPPSLPASNFQFKPAVDPEEEKKKEELAKQEKLERERQEMERKRKEEEEEERRKREAEEIRKRKEAEEAKRLELMLLEQKRKLEEERERKEKERREIERRQEEERLKKLEAERRERERIQREEKARLERLKQAERERLEEIRRIEEEKLRAEIAYQKKIEDKCKDLKEKYQQWKTKIWIEKWRTKAWNLIEERKMRMYQEERKLKYPPVCTEEVLNGNPYGLVIPSVLVLERYSTKKPKILKNENRQENIIINELPVIKVPRIIGRILDKRVKRSGKRNFFPWKLVLSVPDESEAGEFSKHIETFVEMHFVDNFNWQFGKQGGPLYCNEHCLNGFQFGVCIRRVRGCDLYEGEKYNLNTACGSNGLVFLMADHKENVQIAAKRLRNVLLARPPLPKIPVVIFVLGNQIDEDNLIKLLNLNRWRESHLSEYYIFKCAGKTQEELAVQLIQCIKCIAENSAPISPIQCSKLSNFLSSCNFFDSIWRRMDTSLSNYKIILKEPKFLIEYYNTCIDRLGEHFLDEAYEEYTISGDEFNKVQVERPERDEFYADKLLKALELLKLPHWPKEIPKSSHQLNYRIHQYCKKIGNQEKPKIRNIKWILYRIIRRSLLWKGLDIYCDEDINDILLHFPWTQVFQELSRALLNQYNEQYQTGEDIAVIYDTEKLEQLSFECSLIGKFLQKSKRQSNLQNLEEDWNPHLENDSIIYAYTSAIERESSKRKRDSSIDENLDALFNSPAGKRQVLEQDQIPEISNDYSELRTDFQSLSDRLDELQRRIDENKKILIETQSMLQ